MSDDLERDGYTIISGVLDDATIQALEQALEEIAADAAPRASAGLYALRGLLRRAEGVRRFAASPTLRALVVPYLGPVCIAVQATYFDKVPAANWKVPWHQDVAVALAARRDAPGFAAWSVKEGVPHAHAPAPLLAQMLAVRLHLDACGPSNGPLRVLPGTHRYGRLAPDRIDALRAQVREVACTAGRGDALLMRPLLLHASSAAQVPGHRRVLHLVYAGAALPDGLAWHDAVGV